MSVDWLERAQAVQLQSNHAYPTRADAGKRDPTVVASILEDIAQGASFAATAQAHGISARTIMHWRKEDETFDALCKEAMATAYRGRELNIAKDKNYKAQLAWLSARKHVFADPDWTSQEKQSHQGITVNITLRQDDSQPIVDVTPSTPVLDHDPKPKD